MSQILCRLPDVSSSTFSRFFVSSRYALYVVLAVLCALGNAYAITGDLDSSTRVDGNDLIIFSMARDTVSGDADYNPAADLNGDAAIDDSDLALLTSNFGFMGRDFSLWVADSSNARVVKLAGDMGRFLTERSSLSYPISVSVNNQDGTLWVADRNNNRILKLSPQGDIQLHITGFSTPASISVNQNDGSCWVADSGNGRVVKLLPGIVDNYDVNIDSGSHLVIAGFSSPQSVSVNVTTGDCWVAEYTLDKVVKLFSTITDGYDISSPPPGSPLHISLGGFDEPVSVSVNPVDGSCWVADRRHHQLVKISASNTTELLRLSGYNYLRSVSVNPSDGSCWVADTNNHQVVHVSASGLELSRSGGFNYPYGVSVNPWDGSCWIADRSHHHVVKLLINGTELARIGNFNNPEGVTVYSGVPLEGEPTASAIITPESVGVGETVNLNGTGQDSDGTIVRYEWDFDGNGSIDWESPESGVVTHQYLSEGIYTPVFRVTDNSGQVALWYGKQVHVGVLRAIPGSNVDSGTAPLAVAFTASFFDPDDNKINRYEWDFDGDGLFDFSSQASGDTNHTFNAPGTYASTLKIVDTDFTTATAFLTITVLSSPPAVTAAADPSTGQPPLNVNFTGTATDDGVVMLYEWDFDGDGSYDWVSNQSGTVTHLYAATGSYQATLRVTDNQGLQATDTVTVNINLLPTVAVTSAVPQRGNADLSVSFNCTGGDSDGSLSLYEWDFDGDGSYDWSDGSTCQTTNIYTVPGTYLAQVQITDNLGGIVTSSVEITVLPFGFPVASASVIPDSGNIILNSVFTGTAVDAGGIVDYEWSFGDEAGSIFTDDMEDGVGSWTAESPWALDTAESHSGTVSWTDSPGGNYVSTVDASLVSPVFDFSSAESPTLQFWHRYNTEYYYDYCLLEISTNNGSTWSQITYFRGDNTEWHKQVFDLSAYIGFTQVKIRFRLDDDGDANTGDGWYIDDFQISGLRVFSWQSDTTGSTSHNYSDPGSYRPLFRVTDTDGNQDTVQLEVAVTPGLPTAVAEVVSNAGITPFTVSLIGNNSTDPNGTIDLYQWFIQSSDLLTLNANGYATSQTFIGTWASTGATDVTSHQEGIENVEAVPGESYGGQTWFVAEDDDGIWNLERTDIFNSVSNKYGYSYTNLYSPFNQTVRIWFGADDAARFWVNGELLYTKTHGGGIVIDQHNFEVVLKQGWNPVLVSVSEGTGSYSLAWRVTDLNNEAMQLQYRGSSATAGVVPDWSDAGTGNTSHTLVTPGKHIATLLVTDNDGYRDSSTVELSAQQIPQVTIVRPATNSEVGRDVIFQVETVDEGEIVLYEWDFDGDGIYELSSSVTGDSFHSYARTGPFTPVVRVTDNDGFTDTASINISVVNVSPEITSVTAVPDKGRAALAVTFTVNATDIDGTVSRYRWDFDGNGVTDWESASTGNTTHTYNVAGNYSAVLEVTDSRGQSSSYSIDIIVKTSDSPLVTAAVTPVPAYTGQITRLAVDADSGTSLISRFAWDVDGDGTEDWADTSEGSVYSYSSQYNTTTWAAENLLDGQVGTNFGWSSSTNPVYPVELIFSLAGLQIHIIDQIVINPYTTGSSDYWGKGVELLVSDSGTDPADFVSVATFELARSGVEQFFTFPAVSARYVKLNITSSQNSTYEAQLGEFKVFAQGAMDNLLAIDGVHYHIYNTGDTYNAEVSATNSLGITDNDTVEVVVLPVGESTPVLWVADQSHDQIVQLTADGTEIQRIGGFNDPYSIDVFQSDGSLWVADRTNDDVVKLDKDGTEIVRLTNFNNPHKVSVDQSNGSVWIASYEQNQIVHLAADGTELLRLDGLNRPTSVDVNETDHSAWVADYNNHRMLRYADDGTLLTKVTGFYNPRDVAVDPTDGTVWIADRYNDRVVRLAADTPDSYDVNRGQVTVIDETTVNEHDGTLLGDAQPTADGKFSNGMLFDGNGDYVRIAHSSNYRPTGAVTVETWFKADDWASGDQSLVSVTEAGGWCFFRNGDNLSFSIEIGDTYYYANVDHSTVSIGEWHHFAGVFDGTNVHFYLDGELKSSTPASGLITYHASNSLLIGAEASSGTSPAGSYFTGKIDDVRIWGRALSGAEILAGMSQELAGTEADLLAYWQFNEPAGVFHKIVTGFNDPVFLDVNSSDGTCWVSDYYNNQMVQISADGETELSRASGFYNPHIPAVNPVDGTVWIADYSHGQLVKLSANGTELVRKGGYSNPTAVAIDLGIRNLDQPPVVLASATPLSGDVPLAVTFTGSATDNGSIIRYEWDFNGDNVYDFSSETSGNTSHTFTASGIYRPVFRVTDNENLVAYKYFTVQAGTLQVNGSASPDKGAAPLAVSFTGSAMSISGLISSYQWDFDGDGVYDWSSASSATVNHTYSTNGLYMARLRVTDSAGESAESVIPVTVSNTWPVANITVTPTSGSYPLTVSLTNNNSFDSDGSIVLYEWDYDGDGVFDYSSATQGSTSFQYTTSGIFHPTLRVTDNDGLSDEKRQEIVIAGQIPVALAAAIPTEGVTPLSVHFNGTGSDPDGVIALYEWSFADYSFLADDMETGSGDWQADANWALIDTESYSSSHCWTDSPSGMYDNNVSSSLRTVTYDLSAAENPVFTFYHRYDLEDDWDYGYVEILSGDDSWTPLATFTGTNETWNRVNIDLEAYKGSAQVSLRFHIVTDDYYTRDGWYIDDVRLWDRGYFSWSSIANGQVDNIYEQIGVYDATLRVTDDSGQTATDSVKITVQQPGTPVAVAEASPQSGGHPLQVTFTADNSSDSGGSLVKYEWDLGNQLRVESAGYRDGNSCRFLVNEVQVGTNNRGFNLVVLDPETLMVVDSRSFDTYYYTTAADEMAAFIRGIPNGRIVMVAVMNEASNNMNNNGHSALELLGSRLSRNIAYHDSWALIGIKGELDRSSWERHSPEYGGNVSVQGGTFTYSSATAEPFVHTYDQAGSFIARLRVTDNSGLTDEDIVTIEIGTPTAIPAAYPASGVAPLQVNFVCNGEDSDGTIEYFKWDYDGNGTWDSTSRRSDTVSHTFTTPGIYEAVLQVIDNDGLSDEKSLTITVSSESGDNIPKAYADASPLAGEVALTVNFDGHGTDLDGTLQLFEWDFDGNGVFDWSSDQNGEVVHSYTAPGIYSAVLRVTDNQGFAGTDIVQVNVRETGAPVVTASADPASGSVPLSVTFSGGVDGNYPITLYEWDFDGNGSYDWSSEHSADTIHSYSAVGIYDAQLRVTDSQGIQGVGLVQVTASMAENLIAIRSSEGFDPDRGQQVTITSSLSAASSSFTVKIVDQAGVTVRTLVNNVARGAGVYLDQWDGRDDSAVLVDSGIYFFVIDYVVNGETLRFDLTGNAGNMVTITPTYSTAFNPVEDQFLTATFSLSSPAEITTYVSPFSGGAGNRIRTIHLRTPRKSGTHVIAWDGVMDDGTMASLDQSYVMAVFAYGLSENAIIVERKPIVFDLSSDPDFYNPANPYNLMTVDIFYSLSKDSNVMVSIYDETAHLIRRWIEHSVDAGQHSIQWDGMNSNSMYVAPGMYRMVLVAEDSGGNSSRAESVIMELFY